MFYPILSWVNHILSCVYAVQSWVYPILFCESYHVFPFIMTSRPILWNKNLRSICVSAGWMYKIYYFFMDNWLYIWYFVLYVKKFGVLFYICCSFLLCKTQVTCYLYRSRHIIFRDYSKFNHFFCLHFRAVLNKGSPRNSTVIFSLSN